MVTKKLREASTKQSKTTPSNVYRDYSKVRFETVKKDIHIPESKRRGPRGGVADPFPFKLYRMLEQAHKENLDHIVSWLPHGRGFVVHSPSVFADGLLPRFFKQSKVTSFQRQLNLYGFMRIGKSKGDRGGYFHQLFLRGRPDICKLILRTRVKGTKAPPSVFEEPDFSRLPPCPRPTVSKPTPAVVDACSSDSDNRDDSSRNSMSSCSTLGPQPVHSAVGLVIKTLPYFKPAETPDFDSLTTEWEKTDLVPIEETSFQPHKVAESTTDNGINLNEDVYGPVPMNVTSATFADMRDAKLPASRSVSPDVWGKFEGRSFRCIDDASIEQLDVMLVSEKTEAL